MNRERALTISWTLLRVVAALMFFQVGGLKLFGWFGGMPGANGAPPPVLSQIWCGAVLEVVGGALIALGLCTRPIAFVLSGEMAVAYWQFHAPKSAWPIVNEGQGAVLYCFLFLFMSAYGAGAWSLDAVLRKKRM